MARHPGMSQTAASRSLDVGRVPGPWSASWRDVQGGSVAASVASESAASDQALSLACTMARTRG